MLTAPQFSPAALQSVLKRIAIAAEIAQRDPADVHLLAVSKQQPVERIRAAAAAGQREFGENYVQEGLAKIAALDRFALTWHFIGQLQSNKTREVAQHFQWVHTVDRARIARAPGRATSAVGPTVASAAAGATSRDEPGKGGCRPDDLPALAAAVAAVRDCGCVA